MRRCRRKMIRKIRTGMMPPPGARRPGGHRARGAGGSARDAHRQGRAGQPESGLAAVPAAQPGRVPARGQGSARARRRRQRVPSARHDQPRLRQRRRCPGLFAGADGRLPARREPGHGAGGRRRRRRAQRGALPRAEDRVATAARRRRAVRHARRRLRHAHVSRPTANTSSAWTCTATPMASSSAVRHRANSSSCRSTAMRKALSTSTRAWPT